ncbi:MAG: DUF2058 domain-containing protein, partial [Panacagrimonas sp.]
AVHCHVPPRVAHPLPRACVTGSDWGAWSPSIRTPRAMSLSLRDQLLQAGLLDPKKAKEQARDQRNQRREQGNSKKPPGPDPRELAQQKAAAEKAARDAELNRKQQEKLEQKARRAEVRQLVEQHRVTKLADSDELYNFIDGSRIRRLPVDRAMREKLVAGTWVIVRCAGRYEIVPADIAARIVGRDPHAALQPAPTVATTEASDGEEDPYKDFKVPDDLMW